MPVALPGIGELTYGTITFDQMVRSKLTGKPIYDDAQRSVKYVEWTLEVAAYINAGAGQTSDADIELLRMGLTEPGKALIYAQRGFGSLHVNDPNDANKVRDVLWGPTPELLSYVPIGSASTAFVEWKVVFHIPECDHSKTRNRLMMGNYEVTWGIDDGWTSITYSGAIEIPITHRVLGNLNGPPPPGIEDNADRWRYIINPEVGLGFRRERQSFKLSKNRNRLDFTITDKQVPVPLPNSLTLCDVDHSVESGLSQRRGFLVWDCMIGGTVRCAPGEQKQVGWWRIALILASRLGWARRFAPSIANLPGNQGKPLAGSTVGNLFFGNAANNAEAIAARQDEDRLRQTLGIIVTDFSVKEKVFDLATSFVCKYRIYGANLSRILQISGLWRPIDGTSFASYRDSVRQTVNDQRGQARLEFKSENETLIDLCLPTRPPRRPQSNGPMGPPAPDQMGPPAPQSGVLNVGSQFSTDQDEKGNNVNLASALAPGGLLVNAASSWLSYTCTLVLEEEDHVIRHKPLSGNLTMKQPAFDPLNGGAHDGDNALFYPTVRTDTPDIIQRIAAPSYRVRLVGSAVRLGFRITPPRLIKFAGQKAVPVQERAVTPEVVASVIQGTPVYSMSWDISYLVADAPRNSVPANPQLGTPGVK